MRIGTMYFGRVEPLEAECVETKFLVIGVPLVPLESVYLLDEVSRRGVPLPQVHGLSALAGYLRLFLGLGAVGLGIWGYIEGSVATWVMAAICLAGWVGTMFFMGKLSEKERAQRLVLKHLTGLGAPPEILPIDARAESERILENLYAKIRRAHDLDVATDWREQIGQPTPEELQLVLFALARYDGAGYEALWESIGGGSRTSAPVRSVAAAA